MPARTVSAEELEPLARALVGAAESRAGWWLENCDQSAEAMARALMDLAWLGFGELADGQALGTAAFGLIRGRAPNVGSACARS